MIVSFIGAMGAIVTIVFASFFHWGNSFRAEMASTRNELNARMDAGFETLNKRLDHLDRDVSFLMRKEFGENPNN